MTKEDKELLLKDLCARQPHKVKISVDDDNLFIPRLKYIDGLICHFYECAWTRYFDEIKPFLRSMSSMTEEERTEYFLLTHRDNDRVDNIILVSEADAIIDWLYAHYLDYRGLIRKGLALEAPEGMYESNIERSIRSESA